MTDAHKKAADVIVEAYKEKQGKAHNIHGFLGNLQDKAPLSDLRYASHILLHKGILMAIDGVNRENLMLSDKGWDYESFDKLLAEEKRKQDLEEALISSSINANKAGTKVNKLFWLTFAVAVAGVIIQLLSYTNDKEKHSLQQEVKRQDTLIQQMQNKLSQKESVLIPQKQEKTFSKTDTVHH